LFIILLIDILWYYLIKTDFFVRGRITRHVHKIASVRSTDWLTILPSILLSKYNASLTGPPATLFTRCHVFQTWLLSTASLAGTHSQNELFHPPRRRERERERERGREPGKKVSVYDAYPRRRKILSLTPRNHLRSGPWSPPYKRGRSEGWNVGVITAAETTTNRIADADWIMYRANCHSEMDSRLHCRCTERT